MEQVALHARVHHETINWLVLTDCSNALNTVKRMAVLAEAAACVPALTPFIPKGHGDRPAPVFSQMDSGQRRNVECSSGVQQGDAMGPALFCMPLLPVLKRIREEFERRDVEVFAYLDDISIGMSEIKPDTVRAAPVLQHELCKIGITMNPSKSVALPPKGMYLHWKRLHSWGASVFALLKGGRVKVVGVPMGNDAFAMNSALEIVRDGVAEQLARIIPRTPDKQSANHIATSSMVKRTSYIERVVDPELSLPACQRADTRAMWMLKRLLELPGTADESSFFEDRCPANRLTLQPHQKVRASFSTGARGVGLS